MFKNLFKLLFVMVLVFSIVGCSSDETNVSSDSSDSNKSSDSSETLDKVKLSVAVPTFYFTMAENITNDYMQANSNVEVEVIEIVANDGDLYSKSAMMMKSTNTSPDIICEDGFMINSDVKAGYLEPIDEKLSQWDEWSKYEDSTRQGVTAEDGKIYAIPLSTDVLGIWYDKNLFAEAGLPVPFEPKNWDEIISAGEKLKNLNKEELIPLFLFASKTASEKASMRTYQVLLSGTDGTLYDFEKGKWVIDKVNMEKVLGFVDDVYNKKQIGAPLSLVAQSGIGNMLVSDQMQNGKLGMMISGTWESPKWKETGNYPWAEGLDVWGFAKIPTSDSQAPEYTTMSGGWTWAIPANSDDKEEAWKLLKFMTNKESMLKFALLSGEMSPRSDVAQEETYLNQPSVVFNEAAEMLQYTNFRPSVDNYPAVSTILAEAVESVAMGQATVEEAIAQYEANLKRIVGEEMVIEK